MNDFSKFEKAIQHSLGDMVVFGKTKQNENFKVSRIPD